MPPRPDAGRIPSLDGFRAIAIGLVILSHRALAGHFPHALERVLDLVQPGVIGVRLFFIISGFLITSLLIAEQEQSGSIALGRFYLRRTLRLIPALLFYVAVVVALDQGTLIRLAAGDVLHALTYTTNFHTGSWYLQHTWSLSIEEQFYLLWPAVLLLSGRKRATWIACAVLLAGPVIKLWMTAVGAAGDRDHIAYTFRGVADTLAAGCTLALLRARLHKDARYCRALSSPVMALAPLVAVICWSAGGHWRIAAVTQLISIVLATLWIDRVITYRTAGARLLNLAPIAWIGRISYSLYLWQMLFTAPKYYDPWQALPMSHNPWRYAWMFAMATLSYYAVERPCLRFRDWIEQHIGLRPADAQAAALAERVAHNE